ncbi:tachykinin-3a [Gadus macrocephalus]|uniref:tachykinin-3a n=1 Tax=Gadus macrocephalus TaxID=80720 RepID=UPI0028CBA66E|nr:tachykinin-3a [Gadus macrocephalus]
MRRILYYLLFSATERRRFTQHDLPREWNKCAWSQRVVRTNPHLRIADWRYAGSRLSFYKPKGGPLPQSSPDLTAGSTAHNSTPGPFATQLSAQQNAGRAKKMRISLVLVTLFLVMKLRSTQSRCEEPGSRRPLSDPSLVNRRNIVRRSSDLDYDSFVGLMGRRNTEAANELPSANKREMHDIFVGLMGRRNSETDDGPWKKTDPERRGVFLNKCRLRFRRGF